MIDIVDFMDTQTYIGNICKIGVHQIDQCMEQKSCAKISSSTISFACEW